MENNQTNQARTSSQSRKEDIVVGIDVGTTKIAAFIGRKEADGKVSVIGFGKTRSVGVERGSVTVVVSTAESIKKAVEAAEAMCGYKVHDVYVGIAGYNVRTVSKRGSIVLGGEDRIITQADIDALLKQQMMADNEDGVIDLVPQSYIIDEVADILDPIGRVGKKLECNYNLITGDVKNIRNIKWSVEQAGYNVKDLILEPIASSETVLSEDEKNAGVCLVDIGGGTTDMAIFYEGILKHTAVIQLAGNSITNDIKEGCGVLREQAELLKIKYGECIMGEDQKNKVITIPTFHNKAPKEICVYDLADIIHARMEMILEQVSYELKASGTEKKLLAGIVLTGGGSKMKHLQQLSDFVTGIPSQLSEVNKSIIFDDNFKDLDDPMYSTGIGLVLKGFELKEENESCVEEIRQPEPEPEPMEMPEEKTPAAEPKEDKPKKTRKPKKQKESISLASKVRNFLERIMDDPVE